MKVVIIEDEKPAARKLERLISNFTDLQLVATLHSVEDAVDWFSKMNIQTDIFRYCFGRWFVF